MRYVGIDGAYRRAAWCAKQADGTIAGEGFVPTDEDGLQHLFDDLVAPFGTSFMKPERFIGLGTR